MYSPTRLIAGFAAVFALSFGAGCAVNVDRGEEEYSEGNGTDDLQLGEVEADVSSWGSATTCKPIPVVEPLKKPEITISLDGLTLHLRDREGTYDRVFPIGPGAIENGKSLTPVGTFYTGSNTAEVKDSGWGYYYPCRMWWTDTDTGKKSPVFAGLPFIRLAGPPTAGYGIHGPIDNFTAPNGGTLRRGYVSHGCVRMSAADIVELYGRIKGRAKTPVKVQQEVERLANGSIVELASRFIGSECVADAECTYPGGVCRLAAGATRGTCTLPCTKTCPDKAGEAPTFCAVDPANGKGMCVPKASTVFNDSCDRYAGRLVLASGAARPDRSATADVCKPAR